MTTWTISTLERELSDGGVVVAHWRATAVDGDFSASSYGTVGFTPDASASGFIAYDSLTEADVVGWVQAEVDKDAIEASLAAQIEADKNPTQAAGVPW
jgi:hypothetical protein